MSFSLIYEMLTNILLLFSLTLVHNLTIFSRPKSPVIRRCVQGALIGGISTVLMNNSFLSLPGVIFDTRTVLLSVSGLYFGTLQTVIGLGIAGAYRIWLGGAGTVSGVMSILVSAGLGMLFRYRVKKGGLRSGWRFNAFFGLIVHGAILAVFILFLPRPENRSITQSLALPYLLLLPAATGLLGRIISFQDTYRVTQRKLLESRELYHSLFRDNHTIMLIIDPETGNIADANHAAVEFYGWSADLLQGMDIHEINTMPHRGVMHKIDKFRQGILDGQGKNAAVRRPLHMKTQHRLADGSQRHVEVYSTSIRQEGKDLVYSIIHDITDRFETEKKLKKSEYQLSRAELISRLGHWELNLDKKHFSASAGAMKIYGVENGRMDMHTIQSIPLKEYRPRMDQALTNLITKGDPYDLEFRIMRPVDGEILAIHSQAEYDRETNTVFGVILDITPYKKAENAIQQEKERLDVTLHSIGDGVITTDNEGRIQLMNPIAEEMTGWSAADARMRPLPEVFHIIDEYTRLRCPNPVDLVLQTRGIIELANHTLLISQDGREMIISDSGAPIKDREGEIIGTVLVFRDTTEKQMLQSRMQRAEKLESLGILAGGIAHDFNNLLAGIFGYLELARSRNKDEKISEYLDLAMQVYSRTADLTRQLLTFSKGNLPNRKTTNISSLIHDSVNFSLSGSFVSCTVSIDEDLHSCSVDENQIGQVLDNLLINAKQAMLEGGSIELSAENVFLEADAGLSLPQGDYVRVTIKDTGHGIPQNVLPRIFDPFYSTKELGSGLGLATCYSILEKHDGTIDVQSSNEGSVFRFYLPVVNELQTESDGENGENAFRSKGRILVMDDEPFLRNIMREMLHSMGFTVTEAQNGQEVLNILTRNAEEVTYTAAILDLTIPGAMGGIETVRHIREQGFTFPVFATSGYSEDAVMAKPEKYGFTNSLTKPFRRKDLSGLLSRYLH